MVAWCELLATIETKALGSPPLHFIPCQPLDGCIGRSLLVTHWHECLGPMNVIFSSSEHRVSCVPSQWCFQWIGV